MAKRTGILIQMHYIENAAKSLRRLTREVGLMLKDALDAYVQRDVTLAYEVISRIMKSIKCTMGFFVNLLHL